MTNRYTHLCTGENSKFTSRPASRIYRTLAPRWVYEHPGCVRYARHVGTRRELNGSSNRGSCRVEPDACPTLGSSHPGRNGPAIMSIFIRRQDSPNWSVSQASSRIQRTLSVPRVTQRSWSSGSEIILCTRRVVSLGSTTHSAIAMVSVVGAVGSPHKTLARLPVEASGVGRSRPRLNGCIAPTLACRNQGHTPGDSTTQHPNVGRPVILG